jgi:hypothetical protein
MGILVLFVRLYGSRVVRFVGWMGMDEQVKESASA